MKHNSNDIICCKLHAPANTDHLNSLGYCCFANSRTNKSSATQDNNLMCNRKKNESISLSKHTKFHHLGTYLLCFYISRNINWHWWWIFHCVWCHITASKTRSTWRNKEDEYPINRMVCNCNLAWKLKSYW